MITPPPIDTAAPHAVDDAVAELAEKARVLYAFANADPAAEDTSAIKAEAELAAARARRVGRLRHAA